MNNQRLFYATFAFALLANLFGGPSLEHVSEIVLAVSITSLLLLSDLARLSRRVVAMEQFLATTNPIIEAIGVPSHPLTLDRNASVSSCAKQMQAHLNSIIGERNPKTSRNRHDQVRDLIATHMRNCGWEVSLESFTGPHGPAANVIAEKRGEGNCQGIVIVGAHYDTVTGTPGADDNGIAVAGVLALAEMLRHVHFEKTVRLVAWDLEEQQGWGKCLLGSKEMVRNIRRKREKIDGVICLEMIGMSKDLPDTQRFVPGIKWVAHEVYKKVLSRGNKADFIATVANPQGMKLARTFVNSASSCNLPSIVLENVGLVRWIRDLRRSDHAPFWSASFPAVMLTDTANFRSAFYHTEMDRPEMINFEFSAKVVTACRDSVCEFAEELK